MSDKDSIVLTGLKISCIIGIFEWERRQKQDVLIDLKFPCDIRRASRRDHIRDTVDYKKIAKATIAFVEKSRFQLVETLAEKLAAYLLEGFGLDEVFLTLSKPGAIRGSKNVGIEIHRSRVDPKEKGLVFLSLGSNVEPQKNLELALREIQERYALAGLSHVYETSPVGYVRQPSFWNLVAAIETEDRPEPLRKWIDSLEKRHGRTRSPNANGPRTLDVDLILWKDLVQKYRRFSLPHPDIETKAFVFFPLLEVQPNLIHPQKRKALVEMAASFEVGAQKIKQLTGGTFPEFPPKSLGGEPPSIHLQNLSRHKRAHG